jgi:hypothetical protein
MELTERIKMINLGISIGKRLAEKEAAERQAAKEVKKDA